MSLRFPIELPVEASHSSSRGIAALRDGELVAGKVTRVTSDGQALIRFPGFEAKTSPGQTFPTGTRVFAHAQRVHDQALLSLLPNAQEGDILSGSVLDSSAHLGRFDEYELRFRPASGETASLPSGTPIRAQLQMIGHRPVLQMLPEGSSGPVMRGTIVAARDDGTVLFETRDTVLFARTGGGAQKGDVAQAVVRQVADKEALQVLPNGLLNEGASGLAKIFGAPHYARMLEALFAGELRADVSREILGLVRQLQESGFEKGWLSNLARALETLLLNPQKPGLAGHLAAATRDSGLFFESRLLDAIWHGKGNPHVSGDLKAALLAAHRELTQMLDTSKAASLQLSEAASTVGQLLDLVTAEQLVNVRALASNQFYIQLPFLGGFGLEHVQIRISGHGKRPRKIDHRNVALTLVITTSNLGRVRASVSIIDGQVNCQFKASRESVTELFNKNIDPLRRGLEGLNYRVAYIGCITSEARHDYSIFAEPAVYEGFDVRV